MFFEMDCACKGKNLDKMLQPTILMLLYKKEQHGSAIIQEIGETVMFGGTLPDKAGVYRYLKKMEKANLIKSNNTCGDIADKSKKVYNITDHGRKCLMNWMVSLNNYSANIKKLSSEIKNTIV